MGCLISKRDTFNLPWKLYGVWRRMTTRFSSLRRTSSSAWPMGTKIHHLRPANHCLDHHLCYRYTHAFREAKRYYKTSMNIVKRNHIRFVTASTGGSVYHSPEILEKVHEKAALLAQMVHLEVHVYTTGQATFSSAFELPDEFKSELTVCLYQHCVSTKRIPTETPG